MADVQSGSYTNNTDNFEKVNTNINIGNIKINMNNERNNDVNNYRDEEREVIETVNIKNINYTESMTEPLLSKDETNAESNTQKSKKKPRRSRLEKEMAERWWNM